MSNSFQRPGADEIYSVSVLSQTLKFKVNQLFHSVWVEGEVSSVTYASSGHIYLTLKDPEQSAQISVVVWNSTAQWLPFKIEKGQEIYCFGGIDVYPPRGQYQLSARKVEPKGAGSLQLAFKQLHAKLQQEGLFAPEIKKPLPKFPRRIAVVTSPTGAAIRDFLQILNARWQGLDVIIVPTKVQGEGSAVQIARCIDTVARFAEPPDVLVVTRGGGSIEDLWSFNEEIVVRAIHRCPIPIISGVGHEIDTTLSDLAADARALTPSDAAVQVIPEQREVVNMLSTANQRMRTALTARLEMAKARLESLASRPALTQPLNAIHRMGMQLDDLDTRSKHALQNRIHMSRNSLTNLAARIESINPLAVLARGYSLTTHDGVLVTDCEQVSTGDQIQTRVGSGTIISRVEKKEAE